MDQIKATWISAGMGTGEIHIAHQNTLTHRELDLIQFANNNGLKHQSLNEYFWVLESNQDLDESKVNKIKKNINRLV